MAKEATARVIDPTAGLKLLPIDATGRWTAPAHEVGVRGYPYPYFAALAVANENSYADVQLFEDVHGFISGRRSTQFGDGLGLEVGDSFAVGEDGAPQLADGDAGPAEAERLEQLSRTGWLDSLYCPNPSSRPALTGILARWPAERRPAIFLGSASPQDVAALEVAGVRFFGDDALIEIDKFGDHQDHRIVERFQLAARDYDWRRWIDRTRGADLMTDAKVLVGLMNRTLSTGEAAGSASFLFKRYSGPWLASMPTFCAQVTSVLLDQLVNHAGAVIVQQQLGRWSLVGAAPDKGQARPNTAPALDRHAVAAWLEIADRQAAGKLWVATTARLLDYLWRRQSLDFTVEKSPERWIIRLQGLRCPVLGDRALEPKDLNGLSFTVPENAPEIVVTAGVDGPPMEMQRASDPAHRLRDAVYRPWTPLEWPEL
jgi:hypothetical protein